MTLGLCWFGVRPKAENSIQDEPTKRLEGAHYGRKVKFQKAREANSNVLRINVSINRIDRGASSIRLVVFLDAK